VRHIQVEEGMPIGISKFGTDISESGARSTPWRERKREGGETGDRGKEGSSYSILVSICDRKSCAKKGG